MKVLPKDFKSEFDKKFGCAPVIIIGVTWEDGVKYYSNFDGTAIIAGTPCTIYNAIQDFSNFAHALRYDNVGTQHQISVSLFDYSGHFKNKFLHSNLYGVNCTIYLGSSNITTTIELFSGKIRDPLEYNPDTKILTFDIVSYDLSIPVGYTPSIDFIPESNANYEYYKYFLNTEMWPMLFGTVRYKPTLIMKLLECTSKSEIIYVNGSNPYYMKLEGDLLNALEEGEFYTFHLVMNNVTLKVTGDIFIDTDEDKCLRFYNTNEGDSPYLLEPIEYSDITVIGQSDESLNKLTLEIKEGVWIEGMTCELVRTGASNIFIKCSKQNGNKCVMEYPNSYSIAAMGGSITYLPVTSIAKASSCDYFPTVISEGTRLVLMDLDLQGYYVIDTKLDTILDKVYIQCEDGLEELPTSLYETQDVTEIWEDVTHLPCKVLHLLEEAFLFFEKRNLSFEDIYITAHNTNYISAYQVCKYLVELYSSYIMIETEDEHVCNFVLQDSQNLSDILSELAWQKFMIITRINPNMLKLIELTTEDTLAKFTFTSQNLQNPKVFFKNIDDVKTQISATIRDNDHTKDVYKITKIQNTTIYGVLDYQVDYYVYKDKESLQLALDAWLARLSVPYIFISFTGYLDSVHLELWDRVHIDLGTLSFYDITQYLPVTNKLPQPANEAFGYDGVITDINMRPLEGIIDFTVRLDRYMGEE